MISCGLNVNYTLFGGLVDTAYREWLRADNCNSQIDRTLVISKLGCLE